MRSVLISFIFLLLLVGLAAAVPNTLPATMVGNNNFTLNADGGVGNTYFRYGTVSGNYVIQTLNVDPTKGYFSNETGSPITPSTIYYAVACDSTGCDSSPVTFTTGAMIPLPTSTLGTAITNMTQSRFNINFMPANILIPYTWLFPDDTKEMSITIVFGMFFFFIYIGLWLRTRSVATGVILGLVTSSFILFTNQGLNLGIPVEFIGIAQALLYASLAGILLAFLKK